VAKPTPLVTTCTRVDARDDIGQLRESVRRIGVDMRAEREGRSRDVREIYRKLDSQSERIRSLTPRRQPGVGTGGLED